MAQKLFSLVLMLVLALPVVIFAFAGDESKTPIPAEVMQKQIADAIKLYGEKNEVYRKDVLDLFERKEKFSRDKGDLKMLNLIKKEKDVFFESGKDPTLFFVTDQKRFLELAKLDLIKAYEKTIKDCLKMKLDVEAEGFSKELEEIRTGKVKDEEKKAKPILQVDLGKGVKLEMLLIPAGKFMMGSPESEVGRKSDETQREVTLSKPFYMGKYEVTQEQWQAVMGNNPSRTKGAKLPVTNVSWNDCQDYIKKLNGKTNGGYRLPSEAEWEYACRAGTTTAYSFGVNITPRDANYDGSKIGKPVAVGSYKANAFGLYDMHGNVKEWCEDWYGDYPAGSVKDPKGPETGPYRVLRGGSYGFIGSLARSSSQYNFLGDAPQYLHNGVSVGFRLVRTP